MKKRGRHPMRTRAARIRGWVERERATRPASDDVFEEMSHRSRAEVGMFVSRSQVQAQWFAIDAIERKASGPC